MKGSPAYYQRTQQACADQTHLGHGQALAVETMLRAVRSTERHAPLGVYAPWAKLDGSVTWTPIARPEHEVALYPITAETVDRVNAASYGSEVPWVGVVTEAPVQALVADAAWDATRYDLFATEAIYDVADDRPAPRISFLYWARLHDDVGGGRESLDSVARRLGGMLVFPAHLPADPGRRPPVLPFQTVLAAQLAGPQGIPELAGIGEVAAAAQPDASALPLVGRVLLGAIGAGALWAVFGKRPKRRAR